MYFPPKIWVFYLVVFCAKSFAVSQPLALPVRGFPFEIRQILSVAESRGAWAVGGNGVAESASGGWKSLHPPKGSEVALVLPYGTGFIAASTGFCAAYKNGVWRDLAIDDTLYSGAASSGEALISGRRGVYHISADGAVTRVLSVEGDDNYYIHQLHGALAVATVKDGLLIWDREKNALISPTPPLNWARGREVGSIQELEGGNYFIGTSVGFFLEDATGEHSLLPEASRVLLKEGFLGAYLFNNTLIALSWKGGVSAYSIEDGRVLWRIANDSEGGNFLYIQKHGADLILGSASGLYVIPDPLRYAFLPLPADEVNFAHGYNGKVLISLGTKGVFNDEGVLQNFGGDFSLAQFPNGDFVEGRWGKIVFHKEGIEIPGLAISGLSVIDDDHIAILQPGMVNFMQIRTHELLKLPGAFTPNSIASAKSKKVFVGTTTGVLRFSNMGVLELRFGVGNSRVHEFRDGIVALDSEGTLFDQDGTKIAKLPLSEMLDAEEWAGELCLLARTPDGTPWVGQVKRSGWTPLDIPLPMVPEAIAVKGNELMVVGPGMMVKTSRPRLLEAPVALPMLSAADGRIFDIGVASIGARENSVDLLTGPGRLDPWQNPSISFRVADGDWIPLAPSARVPLPRLSWGTTPISVRSEWGGLSHEEELAVFRATPWWARWPSVIVYTLAFAGFGYGVVRWRTWRLEKRAKRLEEVVEQRTAQLRQAQQAREDFFSMMSHEIRNPLNGVVGLCEIVENAPPEAVAPRERMLLKTLRGCADQLRSILDDILDFSRIDRGEIQLHEEVFELLEAVEGAARGVDAGLKRCVLELPDEPVYLRGDCGKIRQIVTNLVSNALKYGLPPAARVLVQLKPSAAAEMLVGIRVLNTGNTIPSEELEQIFEGYVRGEDARRRRIAGTGLGLAVSRRIALAMQGSLTATSINGLTEFRFELKLPVTIAPVEVPREINRPKNSRALGIEDEPYNRLVLGSILGQLGYEVDWAGDGAEALAHARTGSYDLILTDFMLPDTTGTELAKKLLEMLPDPKPPIIAVTAYSTPEKIQQAKEAGIVAFVTKPVSKKKIELAILGAAGNFAVSRPIDIPTVDCNFTQLLRLQNGAQKLAEYADDLPRAWGRVLASFQQDETPAERARAVHAFRSRILAVHATSASEQVALLEDAALRDSRDDIRHLVVVIEPLLKEIEDAARSRALTHQT